MRAQRPRTAGNLDLDMGGDTLSFLTLMETSKHSVQESKLVGASVWSAAVSQGMGAFLTCSPGDRESMEKGEDPGTLRVTRWTSQVGHGVDRALPTQVEACLGEDL